MAFKFESRGSGGGFVNKGSGGGFKAKVLTSGIPTIDTNGLVLYLDAGNPASYPGSGTTWTDLSGQGNNATLINGPTFDSGNGGSIVFDGNNDYASATTSGFPFGSNAGTISGWAKATSVGGGPPSWIFSYGTPAQSQSRFIGRLGSTFYAGGYNDDITYDTVPLNTWFNMAATWDGSNARMYINGVLVAGPTSKSWNTTGTTAYVGSQTNTYENWIGNIAQVLVYDKVLSDTEVLQNFNVDKARFGL